MITDARMRKINKEFRRKDYATDVLSFPALLPGSLGEMAIATGVLRRQARPLAQPLLRTPHLAVVGLMIVAQKV